MKLRFLVKIDGSEELQYFDELIGRWYPVPKFYEKICYMPNGSWGCDGIFIKNEEK